MIRSSNFGYELRSKALGHSEVVHIQQHFLVHLILHFASSGIDIFLFFYFFVVLSGFFHQQLGHLQGLFTLLGQVLTILVEL